MKTKTKKVEKNIYKLIYNNTVIYVGITKNTLEKRKSCGYTYIPKNIVKASKIELIERTNDWSKENYWIEYYKSLGYNLYNKRKGLGGYNNNNYQKENFRQGKCYYDKYFKEYWAKYRQKESWKKYMADYYQRVTKPKKQKKMENE
jgi:hypothetical protein